MMEIHLHYEELAGEGPHIMMLHGMLSSRAQWDLNIGAIQRVARPVLVELLAHGRSAAPEDPEVYGPEYYDSQRRLSLMELDKYFQYALPV